MQDRQGEAFVIATANDVSALPPELLRKGRFDEVWFVDLPTQGERAEIIKATLRSFKRDPAGMEIGPVAQACEGFTGSEIAALVPDALFEAFGDNKRDITAGDLIKAAKTVVPLSETAKEKVAKLRDWAKGRARPASQPETEQARSTGRALDL
jgi:SpoVK/Ycf46/Vps4 family AAA+-type ATPase